MSLSVTKKTLNLHKVNIKLTELISNWKIALPTLFTVIGMSLGCFDGKGEGGLYSGLTDYFSSVVLSGETLTPMSGFLYYLIFPSVFVVAIFFLGLSVFGSVATNIVPFCFGYVVGCISYYQYSEYILKGLGYCIIMLYPYCVLSLLAIILCCRESINMSQLIVGSISKAKTPNYSFTDYCKAFGKGFLFLLAASAVKLLLEYLFGALFVF